MKNILLNRTFLFLILLIFFSLSLFAKTVSITQLGYIIKKAIPTVKTIAVLYSTQNKSSIVKDAKMAYTILKKKIIIYDISRQFELTKKIDRIQRYKNIAVIIITDKNMFPQKTVKFIADKFYKNKIPVFSNRKNDTKYNALVCMFYNENKKLEKHINLKLLKNLKIEFSNNLIDKFTIDVE